MSDASTVDGLVVKAQSGFFTVETPAGLIVSQIPGRLKQVRQNTDLVAIGDRVTISINEDQTGTIEEVAPRARVLSRARPSAGDIRQLTQDREQVLVANPDQVVFVFSIKKPSPSLRKLDRFLVMAEIDRLAVVVCVNKIDLVAEGVAQATFSPYESLGYEVIYTSTLSGAGIDELRACLQGKISVVAGSSGVGKSSLLNAVEPGLGIKVRSVSEATGKGMHTTRHAELFRLASGGYVADTPGVRGLAIFDVEPAELDAYFREIAPLVSQCRFSDCTHRSETGCAVRAAVETGTVAPQRYDSYMRLREELEQLHQTGY